MCHEWICLSVEMLSHLKIILFTHNQFQLCCLKYWRIPSPSLHCHCQPTSISYLCLCILQNVRIHIIFISSVSNTHSRLQLSCCLVCRVSSVSGLIQKWIEGNLQTKCTHSEYQLPTHMTTVPSTPATTHTQMREQPKYTSFHSKVGAINIKTEKKTKQNSSVILRK